MNRSKLTEAILEKFRTSNHVYKEQQLAEAIRYISDPNLIVFANEIGIDTNVLFKQ